MSAFELYKTLSPDLPPTATKSPLQVDIIKQMILRIFLPVAIHCDILSGCRRGSVKLAHPPDS